MPPGTYQLQLSNSFGCEATTNPVLIGQYGFIPISVADAQLSPANCDLDNGAIRINMFSHDASFYSFEWIDSATNGLISTNTSVENLAAGTYILYATDSNDCRQRMDAYNVQQTGKPQFDSNALKIFDDTCNVGRGAIKNLLMKDASRSYTWAWYNQTQQLQGNTPNDLLLLHEGSYYASVTDQYNCTVTSNLFHVPNIDIVPVSPIVNDLSIPRNTATTMVVLNPLAGTYDLLNDNSPGSLPQASSANGLLETPVITADRSFYVRFTYGNCSSALSLVNVKVFDSTIIYVPSGFTPNNDGLNDRFQIRVQGRINKFSLAVYNRWGNLVFSTNDVNNSWDGTIDGTPASLGVFVYTINAMTYDNKLIRKNGTVTLLR